MLFLILCRRIFLLFLILCMWMFADVYLPSEQKLQTNGSRSPLFFLSYLKWRKRLKENWFNFWVLLTLLVFFYCAHTISSIAIRKLSTSWQKRNRFSSAQFILRYESKRMIIVILIANFNDKHYLAYKYNCIVPKMYSKLHIRIIAFLSQLYYAPTRIKPYYYSVYI